MDKSDKKYCKTIDDLDTDGIVKILKRWDMDEFVDFVEEKQVDGRKLLDITEGIVKLWRPKVNAKKFISFIGDLKLNSNKYLNADTNKNEDILKKRESIESQYQTVIRKKSKEENAVVPTNSIEELLKRIVPAKSFLYRNQTKSLDKTVPSYLPMSATSPKKARKLFRLSSYDYPIFDLRSRSSKEVSDRGYYPMKRNSIFYLNKPFKKQDSRTKYKSLATAEELTDKYAEDHFYEDLCYNEVEETQKETVLRNSTADSVTVTPRIVKFQNLFKNFKIPFLKRPEEVVVEDNKIEVNDKESNIYENGDSMSNMYDSVHVNRQSEVEDRKDRTKLPVEDYLEPVQVSKDYMDVQYNRQKDDSILGYIMSIFENTFGLRRETNVAIESEDSDSESQKTASPSSDRWTEKSRSMVDRPLPVPVENEPYYMNIDRTEAENLLRGQPDGMFVLRPSSQTTHAYTLTVACSGGVHNVGVRRRSDGRLALGFSRRGERTFTCIGSLLRHHQKKRLLLVAEGGVIGATTLTETPHYYQSPSSIPVPICKV
ncbi:uncharacterized protein LOC115439778 [Manduca sexta]|uniref:uncharacterized protein LOC115439778 n=1 Tax=Manduca sexta TaxID=7130 RepID=UPI00188FEB3C|nr:uncharacterized protein LOC115439778 [Manduca sexta]